MTHARNRLITTLIRAGLTVLVLSGYSVVLWVILTNPMDLPEPAERILQVLLGSLTTILTLVINYWFGTSQGSAEKSAEISAEKGK